MSDEQRRHGDHVATFVRFLLVGGASYVVDLGTLLLLHDVADWSVAGATSGAFLVAFLFTFTLNRQWVFPDSSGSVSGQVVRYLVLVAANYVATLGLVVGLHAVGTPLAVAKTIAVVVLAVANFFLYRRFVFVDSAGAGAPSGDPVELDPPRTR